MDQLYEIVIRSDHWDRQFSRTIVCSMLSRPVLRTVLQAEDDDSRNFNAIRDHM
jgi:hypothetical protein